MRQGKPTAQHAKEESLRNEYQALLQLSGTARCDSGLVEKVLEKCRRQAHLDALLSSGVSHGEEADMLRELVDALRGVEAGEPNDCIEELPATRAQLRSLLHGMREAQLRDFCKAKSVSFSGGSVHSIVGLARALHQEVSEDDAAAFARHTHYIAQQQHSDKDVKALADEVAKLDTTLRVSLRAALGSAVDRLRCAAAQRQLRAEEERQEQKRAAVTAALVRTVRECQKCNTNSTSDELHVFAVCTYVAHLAYLLYSDGHAEQGLGQLERCLAALPTHTLSEVEQCVAEAVDDACLPCLQHQAAKAAEPFAALRQRLSGRSELRVSVGVLRGANPNDSYRAVSIADVFDAFGSMRADRLMPEAVVSCRNAAHELVYFQIPAMHQPEDVEGELRALHQRHMMCILLRALQDITTAPSKQTLCALVQGMAFALLVTDAPLNELDAAAEIIEPMVRHAMFVSEEEQGVVRELRRVIDDVASCEEYTALHHLRSSLLFKDYKQCDAQGLRTGEGGIRELLEGAFSMQQLHDTSTLLEEVRELREGLQLHGDHHDVFDIDVASPEAAGRRLREYITQHLIKRVDPDCSSAEGFSDRINSGAVTWVAVFQTDDRRSVVKCVEYLLAAGLQLSEPAAEALFMQCDMQCKVESRIGLAAVYSWFDHHLGDKAEPAQYRACVVLLQAYRLTLDIKAISPELAKASFLDSLRRVTGDGGGDPEEENRAVAEFIAPQLEQWLRSDREELPLPVLDMVLLLPDSLLCSGGEWSEGFLKKCYQGAVAYRDGHPAESDEADDRVTALAVLYHSLYAPEPQRTSAVSLLRRIVSSGLEPAVRNEIWKHMFDNEASNAGRAGGMGQPEFHYVMSAAHAVLADAGLSLRELMTPEEAAHLDRLARDTSLPCSVLHALCSTPTEAWGMALASLRYEAVREQLQSLPAGGGTSVESFTELLDQLRFLSEKDGSDEAAAALEVVEVMGDSAAEALGTQTVAKLCLEMLLREDNLCLLAEQVHSACHKTFKFDLLFGCVGDESHNALMRLKLVLAECKFADIECFCKILAAKLRKGGSRRLAEVVPLVIDSGAYSNERLVKELCAADITSWVSLLRQHLWVQELLRAGLGSSVSKGVLRAAHLLQQVSEVKGEPFCKKLLKAVAQVATKDCRAFSYQLNKLINAPVSLEALDALAEHDLPEWDALLHGGTHQMHETLTPRQLLDIMQQEAKACAGGVNESLLAAARWPPDTVERIVRRIQAMDICPARAGAHSGPVSGWEAAQIAAWAKAVRGDSGFGITEEDSVVEVLSVVARAVKLYNRFSPRSTQLVALVFFLGSQRKGKLANISTGEGKTLTTAMLAVVLALMGKRVDVITSSKVLAVRDSKEYCRFFKMFTLRGDNNCDEACERGHTGEDERKGRYAACDIVYGEAAFFQKDLLLSDFMGKNIRRSVADSAILDEVDHMLIDQATKTLYISHRLSDMRHLKDLFLQIWAEVNGRHAVYTPHNVRSVVACIEELVCSEDELLVNHDVLQQRLAPLDTVPQAEKLRLQRFVSGREDVVCGGVRVKLCANQSISRAQLAAGVESIVQSQGTAQHVVSALAPCEGKEYTVHVPQGLRRFVAQNLKAWVHNAYRAKQMREDDSYFIGDAESQRESEVVIMDKDTGVEQLSTRWSQGLHLFLQLRHSGKLSDESLKAVYISNMAFFKRYGNLYGMTGTVGGIEERKLIADTYDTDFMEVPRFKRYCFEYDIEAESVSGTREAWLQMIVENVLENMDQQTKCTPDLLQELEGGRSALQRKKSSIDSSISDLCKEQISLSEQQADCKSDERVLNTIVHISAGVYDEISNGKPRKAAASWLADHAGIKTSPITAEVVAATATLLRSHSGSTQREAGDFQEARDRLQATELRCKCQKQFGTLGTQMEGVKKRLEGLRAEQQYVERQLESFESDLSDARAGRRLRQMRAMLIICECIDDLRSIEDRVRSAFPPSTGVRVYTYDRSYREFDRSVLEAGDVVIATNIAGRGTHLGVSEEVERNGGLVVVMSNMPSNLRVENQAFGRTARAGSKGTGTYIVYHPHCESLSLDDIKRQRDADEQERLRIISKQSFPKMVLEEALFDRFTSVYAEVAARVEYKAKKTWKGTDHDATFGKMHERLQLESLCNKWALWLNGMRGEIDEAYAFAQKRDHIFAEYERFAEGIRTQMRCGTHMLIDEPGELTKLGRAMLDAEQYGRAESCFSFVIANHKPFADAAHFYRGVCVTHTRGGGQGAKREAKRSWKAAKAMLEERRTRVLSRTHMLKCINAARRHEDTDTQQFPLQNEGEAQLLSTHIQAIDSAVGSAVSEDTLEAAGVTPDTARLVYEELLRPQYGVLKPYRVSKTCSVECRVLAHGDDRQGRLEAVLSQECSTLEKLQSCKPHPEIANTIARLERRCDLCRWLMGSGASHIPDATLTRNSFDASSPACADYESILALLQEAGVVSVRELYRRGVLVPFPGVFASSQGEVLRHVEDLLELSRAKQWNREERSLSQSALAPMMYTAERFAHDTSAYVECVNVMRFSKHFEVALLGRLTHPVFEGHGDTVKKVLLQLAGDRMPDAPPGAAPEAPDTVDVQEVAQEIVQQAKGVTLDSAHRMLQHLEHYEYVTVSHAALRSSLHEAGRAPGHSIYYGKLPAIDDFCCGRREVGRLRLQDHHQYSVQKLRKALCAIVGITEQEADTSPNFRALLTHLGFDRGTRYGVFSTVQQYAFRRKEQMDAIRKHLSELKLCDTTEIPPTSLQALRAQLASHPALRARQEDIVETVQNNLGGTVLVDVLPCDDEDRPLVRAVLVDAGVVDSSLHRLLAGTKAATTPELERVLGDMYCNGGAITRDSFALQDATAASGDLMDRLADLRVLRLPSIAFNQACDPTARLAAIRTQLCKALGACGASTSQAGNIMEVVEQAVGSIRRHREISVKTHDLQELLQGDALPPEIVEYVSIAFEVTASFEEKKKKGFSFQAFLCVVGGVAQIVAGVALEITTCGVGHWLTQALISEGVGDVVYAVTSSMQGEFSWKAYRQYKAQSLALTALTAGATALLSAGGTTSKLAVGHATKAEVLRCIAKKSLHHLVIGVVDAVVCIGADELTEHIGDAMATSQFGQFFEQWAQSNSGYRQRMCQVQTRIASMLSTYGTRCAAHIDSAVSQAMNSMQGNRRVASIVQNIAQSMASALSASSHNLGQQSSRGAIFAKVGRLVSRTMKLTRYCRMYAQLCGQIQSYFDALDAKLAEQESALCACSRKGQWPVQADELAAELLEESASSRAARHTQRVEGILHNAFKAQVSNAFVQPAVHTALQHAARPLCDVLTTPFNNAVNDLQTHIDEAKHTAALEQEEQHRVTGVLAPWQLKALEEKAAVLTLDEMCNVMGGDEFVEFAANRHALANFPGVSLDQLGAGGEAIRVVVRDGGVLALLPSYATVCDTMQESSTPTDTVLGMAAVMEGRPIALCEYNPQGQLILTRTVDPSGDLDSQNPLYLALTDDNGHPHYAPAKQTADGLLTVLPQADGERDEESGGFMDALLRAKGGTGGADDVGVYAQRLKGFAQGLSLEPPEALVNKAAAALPEQSQSEKPCGLDPRLMSGTYNLVVGVCSEAANSAATYVKEGWHYCKEHPWDAALCAIELVSFVLPWCRAGGLAIRLGRRLGTHLLGKLLLRMPWVMNRQVILQYCKKQVMAMLISIVNEAAVEAAFGETVAKVYSGASTVIGTYKGLKTAPFQASLDAAAEYSLQGVKSRTKQLVRRALGDTPIRNCD
eukprot:TRINITY_DN4201_c0_g1_i5.p1 TRINITY_DN4201_c0_g1~~TRINITY_DN4201_c0_g1_i5.p1  ORF type:complete len:4192 (+),score=1134.89 TRINITY_DN4201_c0_g1_i5:1299-12578(+)